MSDKIVDRDFYALEKLQTMQSFAQELKIKSFRMIEIVVIVSSLIMLLIRQNLDIKKMHNNLKLQVVISLCLLCKTNPCSAT